MRQSAHRPSGHTVRTSPYAARVRATRLSATSYEVRVDGNLRFMIEGDEQWPAQWRLFSVENGGRAAAHLAMESECFDLIEQLERGCFWLPQKDVTPAPRCGRQSSYTRYPLPQYLSE